MSELQLQTERLRLVLQSIDVIRAQLDDMSAEVRAEVSDEWLAMVRSATSADPWIHGFEIVQRSDGKSVGQCGFKGPPTDEGVVEIAYAVDPPYQGRGFATEAAQALVMYALAHDDVQLVRAHTLPEESASTRVLTKCGLAHLGEVVDPDDGPVWRWESRAEV